MERSGLSLILLTPTPPCFGDHMFSMQSDLKKTFLGGCTRSSLLQKLSLVAASGGYSLVAAHDLLIAVASLVADHRL